MTNAFNNSNYDDDNIVDGGEFTDDSTNLAGVDDVGGDDGYDMDHGAYPGDQDYLEGETPEEEEERKRKRNRIIATTIAAILVLLTVGWGAWAMGKNSEGDTQAEIVPNSPKATETATITKEVPDTAGLESKDKEIKRLNGIVRGLREDNGRQRKAISDLRERKPAEKTVTETTTAPRETTTVRSAPRTVTKTETKTKTELPRSLDELCGRSGLTGKLEKDCEAYEELKDKETSEPMETETDTATDN